MTYDPADDGRTHINVYSRGATQLGRLLSNFAATPFDLDGRHFGSVEAFWYWTITGREDLCELSGPQAKREGRRWPRVRAEPTLDELRRAYEAKLEAHPSLGLMLQLNELPLVHYYVMDGHVVSADRYAWTVDLWAELAQQQDRL